MLMIRPKSRARMPGSTLCVATKAAVNSPASARAIGSPLSAPSMPVSVIEAPAEASARAMTRPRPPIDPVTSALRPVSVRSTISGNRQRADRGYVVDRLQTHHRRDHRVGLLFVEHARDILTKFALDLLAAHRILRRSAIMFLDLLEAPAVGGF